jgi:hypothetical protein
MTNTKFHSKEVHPLKQIVKNISYIKKDYTLKITSCRSCLSASTSFDIEGDLEGSWSNTLSFAPGGLDGPSDDDDVVGDVPVRGIVKLLSSERVPSGEIMPPSLPWWRFRDEFRVGGCCCCSICRRCSSRSRSAYNTNKNSPLSLFCCFRLTDN